MKVVPFQISPCMQEGSCTAPVGWYKPGRNMCQSALNTTINDHVPKATGSLWGPYCGWQPRPPLTTLDSHRRARLLIGSAQADPVPYFPTPAQTWSPCPYISATTRDPGSGAEGATHQAGLHTQLIPNSMLFMLFPSTGLSLAPMCPPKFYQILHQTSLWSLLVPTLPIHFQFLSRFRQWFSVRSEIVLTSWQYDIIIWQYELVMTS